MRTAENLWTSAAEPTSQRERETLHLFQPLRADQMPDPHQGGREKLYIFSSHLGLIRCLTPIRVSAIMYSQAFLDKHRNTTNVILPHELKHGSCMLSKQALISVTNILQPHIPAVQSDWLLPDLAALCPVPTAHQA